MFEFVTNSAKETEKLGEKFAEKIIYGYPKLNQKNSAITLSLEGELGGGKTTFLKGFAKKLGVKEKIKSPTFIIMRKYQLTTDNKQQITKDRKLKSRFYHFDCYRIENPEELLGLGFQEIIQNPQNIVAIEWGNKIKKLLPKNYIKIKFEFLGKEKRGIKIIK
ncbi:MAG TPA: tRNA (adenosine(37)-N6)-threonylcarbamoyltransferase complex ATPase subunit type 1 TsaE [Candidatus Pacearchaeota archaeon]|nr:tRNA (adenosine(37)-N6)-threonylcarbamoyltransferase complex ATPase subunit type 1 TsaE [Candidatus Pacearchaeota archaeon]HOK93958.1 tRNA (adenosine(37)-N6)-threonylcarbamoyltransferase complex ATPase subunit type 1 TsaE [Candidatus Pacearchaeota archaeon]HPO75029.1 tRNA (adenosine(37)-N6)-threonylcarbamoyltransferase complex ATPase subunit type 1 TsaE [Candidatus Pacearchaeota archaeon]